MPEEDLRGQLRLILWRLEQIEQRFEDRAHMSRKIWAGIAVAMTMPLMQAVSLIVRLVEH